MIRNILRLPLGLLSFYLVSTFPIWILPLINGAIRGIFFMELEVHSAHLLAPLLVSEYQTAQVMAAGYSSSMREARKTGLPPYHIPQLRESLEWYKNLGMVRLDAFGRANPPLDEITMQELYDLMDMLYRKTRPDENEKPWHHWVYVSAQPMRTDSMFLDEWDLAFNDLLQYHYASPASHNAGFHYISCPDKNFCDLFRLKAPSLLHFTTEKEEISSRRRELPGHDPVIVRVIELPVDDPRGPHLAPGVFPSAFNQLRSFTANDDAWKIYSPFSRSHQIARRLEEVSEEKQEKYPWTYGQLVAWEGRLFKYIGYYNDEIMYQIPRALGLSVSIAVQLYATKAWNFVSSVFNSKQVDGNDGNEKGTHESFRNFSQTESGDFDPSWNETAEELDPLADVHMLMKVLMEGFMDTLDDDFRETLMNLDGDSEVLDMYLGDYKEAHKKGSAKGSETADEQSPETADAMDESEDVEVATE